MKIESHNHPSAVEPYQGAATGVGGIVRDIFTMGARPDRRCSTPCASARWTEPRNRYLLRGRRRRHRRLRQLPRRARPSAARSTSTTATPATRCVNAMCVGHRAPATSSIRASAQRRRATRSCWSAPTPAATASTAPAFASRGAERATEEQRPDRPGRQPVPGEAADRGLPGAAASTDWIVGMQDLGAAGLTSSPVEIAAQGRHRHRDRRRSRSRGARRA